MAGIIPAPSAGGSIGFEGQPPVKVTKDGGQFVPGVGVVGRTLDGKLLLDAQRSDPPEGFSLHRSGLVAPGPLGSWPNTRSSQTAYLYALAVNLGTAPTAGDAGNYYAVKATDGSGASLVLPMSTNGQSFYKLNAGAGVQIACGSDKTGAGQRTNTDSQGLFAYFTPTQTLQSTGLQMLIQPHLSGGAGAPVPGIMLRAQLLDPTTLQPIVTAHAMAGSAAVSAGSIVAFPWPLVTTLNAGQQYIMTVDQFESVGTTGARLSLWQYLSAGPGAVFPISLGAFGIARGAVPASATWADVLSPTGSAHSFFIANQYSIFGPSYQPTAILGNGSGALLRGDLAFSIAAQGAPPAGAAGADLNMYALLGISA